MKIFVKSGNPEQAADIFLPLYTDSAYSRIAEVYPALPAFGLERALTDFRAESGKTATLYNAEGGRLFLIGLGKPKSAGFSGVFRAARSAAVQLGRQLQPAASLLLSHLAGSAEAEAGLTDAFVNGLVSGTYQLGSWKENAGSEPHPFDGEESSLTLISAQSPEHFEDIASAARRGHLIGLAQKQVMHLVNMPSNLQTPPFLADVAREWGENHGQKVTVFSGDEIEANQLFALAAVNRGSEYPAQFIVMEYEPENAPEDAPTVGLVGKGITFDTGGLSIKTSAGMYFMKCDMGGAAVVLGFMEAAASLQLPVKLVAVVPVTDNLIDARSFKPSDIICSYSGKTIEIMDTDAEGRLILADGLSWITEKYELDYLFDFATLTGATVRAMGYAAAGMFTPDDALAASFSEAGDLAGERVWRFPLWDEYADDLHSDVADVRNLSGKPVAGGISAAKFLEVFTREHPRWAHFDIAGVAFGESEFGKHKNGTGWGVRLLTELTAKLTKPETGTN